ncbi:magnesium-translocating P-type ATPase [Sphingobium nicotianae]|uniref:Magnesium-transporting ATPase, P-type 1 n=1 Tax=Sphingobium nicotianae TaxID=2782607 RepID=A0A9X1ITJ0_9SPHN|nr:magnesium-translocating P-type ATPase [Sphingobium nicotianae]MBT2189420.1 magnesium-translocating P-type ATPase [Sphingobium nicotianae]
MTCGAAPDNDALVGLTEAEAAIRLRRLGLNLLEASPKQHALMAFLGKFRNPLVLILLVAAAISGGTGDFSSFVIIVAMVLVGVVLDFVQEYRAGIAADALKSTVALQVLVIREGKERTIPAAALVPGDLVRLSAGDLIPADGQVVEARDFFVNQALLTGESFPVEKHAGCVTEDAAADGDLPVSAAFMGSSVISGSAILKIDQTGKLTRLGKISHSLIAEAPPTAFETGIKQFGYLIARVTIALAGFVLLVNLALHRPPLESFLFALALAVGLTPELLPMVVSVTLSRGAMRMAKQKVIVKRLSAIHDLGSMDVLCTDKTGTLTEARIELVQHVGIDGEESEDVLLLGALNSYFESGLKSPLDDAILAHALSDKCGDLSGWSKIDEVPFDFERRRVSVLVEHQGKRILVIKGAPEDILARSTQVGTPTGRAPTPYDDTAKKLALDLFDAKSRDGFRLLAVGWKAVAADFSDIEVGDEAGLVFAGFCAFVDPPKASAMPALQAMQTAGIEVKILSGDNELVTRHLCASLGFAVTGLLTGTEIGQMSEEALRGRLAQTNLFCRVTPPQKHRILLALKQRGHTVGFLGDGINDAPSLHAADVGISVDSGADVAKQSAAMILLDKDLSVLANGVIEGRRTFVNILKYVMMGTSSNFGNMLSMAGASLLVPFLPMSPIQILLNNLMYDFSEVPIPLDEVDQDQVLTPRHWDMGFIQRFMVIFGPISSAFDFLTFGLLLYVFKANAALFQTGWFVESLATQTLVIFVIRTRGRPWASRVHPILAATTISIVLLGILIPATPAARWFGLVPLPWHFLAALAAMALVYLTIVELVKGRFFRWSERKAVRPA